MKKMNLWQSILFFGIPGLLMYVNYVWILPIFLNLGVPMIFAALVLLGMPIIIMFTYVMVDFKRSGEKMSDFFYMKSLRLKEVFVMLGLFVLVQASELLTAPTRIWLAKLPGFKVANHYPDLFKPDYEIEFPTEIFMGMELEGKYWIILLWAVWLVINIGGEEIVWRGYALKRMEKVFGKWAWLVNGILWNIAVHFFIRWSYVGLLPVSLIVPYVCQKTKSFWPGVIIHGIGNLLVYVVIIPGIVG